MRNFDDDEVQTLSKSGVVQDVPQVRETVTLRSQRPRKTYISSESWEWRELRDYVIAQMQMKSSCVGYSPDSLKESGIFKGFINRWGDQAEAIARYVFEDHDGTWLGEPVTPTRFTKGNDPYFAEPIAERLVATGVEPW